MWVFKASEKFYSGIPDILGCYKGKFFAIELKHPGLISKSKTAPIPSAILGIESFIKKGARPIQAYTLAKIKNAQGHAIVADSLGDVKEFINVL